MLMLNLLRPQEHDVCVVRVVSKLLFDSVVDVDAEVVIRVARRTANDRANRTVIRRHSNEHEAFAQRGQRSNDTGYHGPCCANL